MATRKRKAPSVDMASWNQAEAKSKAKSKGQESVENAKSFLQKKDYPEARECVETALNLFPQLENGLQMSIVCETLYYGDMHFPSCGIDWYSLLRLYPSSTNRKVKTHCETLIRFTTIMTRLNFPGAIDALGLLNQAKYVLFDETKRSCYNFKREDSGLVHLWIPVERGGVSFREEYLNWEKPVFTSHVADYIHSQKMSRASKSNTCYQCGGDGDSSSLSLLQLRKLKKQVFDEMPQNPHYVPLKKYNNKLQQGMILGLDLIFINLYEEIRKLEDPQSLWSRLDGFKEQLTQLEEMGYEVGKLRERLETLKTIAERDWAARVAVEAFEAEVQKRKASIANMEAEIEKSKMLVDKGVRNIDLLKKDSLKAVEEFASLAKKARVRSNDTQLFN